MADITEQDRERVCKLFCPDTGRRCFGAEGDWGHDPCEKRDMVAQLLVDERERNQETRLKYCPTHRTIVPAFKDDRLSCCVLADKREAADKAGWGRAIGRVCIWLEEKAQTLIDSGGDVGEAGCVSVRQHRSDARFIRQQPYEPPPSEGKQQEPET